MAAPAEESSFKNVTGDSNMTTVADSQVDGLSANVLVTNIPSNFHSADLRNFFTQLVETGGFRCFHFKRRPQALLFPQEQAQKVLCCPIQVRSSQVPALFKIYHNRHWEDRDGSDLVTRCGLKLLTSEKESRNLPSISVDQLKIFPLDSLPELHPPSLLPNGNVGTPSKHFLDLIRQCRLPARLIKRLGLHFPHARRRKFGSVPLDYGTGTSLGGLGAAPLYTLPGNFRKKVLRKQTDFAEKEEEKEAESSEEEDWDRHEALHGDAVTKRRGRERLYEKEEEVVWEKGGSGLVFHTDTATWDAEEGGFDERTADDWDVDMGAYFGEGPGDKDARDFVSLRREGLLRGGTMEESAFEKKTDGRKMQKRKRRFKEGQVGAFEQHTKGVGRRVMEGQGWKEGRGLGPRGEGMSEALDESDGQNPWCRAGFGYHGEKLERRVRPHRHPRHEDADDPDCVIISTIYDRPAARDAPEPLLQTSLPTAVKFRQAQSSS